MAEYVTNPIGGLSAFADTTSSAYQSQAAQLLIFRSQILGDHLAFQARVEPQQQGFRSEYYRSEDYGVLEVPAVQYDGSRFSRAEVRESLPIAFAREGPTPDVDQTQILSIADELYHSLSPLAVARLCEASLSSSSELVRVSAAATYFELTTEPADLIATLIAGTESDDPLVVDVAAGVLVRIAPGHARLQQMMQGPNASGPSSGFHTSLLIHGTFAKTFKWWQPGGGFHSYLQQNVLPDLYSQTDRFDWSGAYSDAGRSQGGTDLAAWLKSHNAKDANLLAHSHGGSVAMLASHFSGVTLKKMVLLSCPVHMPKYVPNFPQIHEVIAIGVHLDLVILVDGGGQRFNHPKIKEHVLPIWFNHSATHDEIVWQQHNVPAML